MTTFQRAGDIDHFLLSREWRVVRMRALERDGAKCACCGRTARHGVVMNVDHIKPRGLHPELALDLANLQILCSECNQGKGNKFQTDWRAPSRSGTPAEEAERQRQLTALSKRMATTNHGPDAA